MKIAFAAAAFVAAFCGAAHAQSAAEFSDRVFRVANTELQTWINDPIFIYAIREQNELHATMSQRRIDALDRQWRKGGSRALIVQELLGRQGSVFLRDRRAATNGMITEIFLMDRYGLNVAMSDVTSDYWQGDEAKFQETFPRGPGAIHVSELKFDESTGKVQTQVSMTVTDPETGEAIGAVTFGIDLTRVPDRLASVAPPRG